jgi:hypothetical protein
MKTCIRILFPVLLFLTESSVFAQHDFDSLYKHKTSFKQQFKAHEDTIDFYSNDELLEFSLEANFKDIAKNKYDDSYRDAILNYQLNDTVSVTRHLKIKPRGKSRKNICYYPPLKINFKKKELKLDQLKNFDKIKLVGACKNGKQYEQYVLSEYYIYKSYEQLTKYSFKTRLLRIKYIDTGRRKPKSKTRIAFVIEPVDLLTQRLDAIEIEVKRIHPDLTNYELINTLSVFQYMIGNTDFSIPGLHNTKLIKSKDPNIFAPVAIPYDFDYTGIIDAHYAIPSDVLHIESVTERLFRGFCRTEEEFKKTFDLFNIKKESIYNLYETSPYLDKRVKKKTISYLDSFYNTINNDQEIQREFLDACRKDK